MAGSSIHTNLDGSARRYLEFINSLPAAIFRKTLEGKIVFCNRGYARILGFDMPEELIGYPVINLYRNKKDRGNLVDAVIRRGRVNDLPIALTKKDGTPIWCAVTVRAVMDDDGIVVYLDGVLNDITLEIEEKLGTSSLDAVGDSNDVIFFFDLQGNLLDINQTGTELLGFSSNELVGKSLSEFLLPKHRELFLLFLSDILKMGSEEVVLSLIDSNGQEHNLECHALLVKNNGKAHHVKAVAHDITNKLRKQKNQSNSEKFQGVLEMAGGVAHRLNQPLTIVNNVLNEIINESKPQDPYYQKIMTVHHQIKKMNEITKKIGNIKKYEAMDYVAGIKIVDIDKAS